MQSIRGQTQKPNTNDASLHTNVTSKHEREENQKPHIIAARDMET